MFQNKAQKKSRNSRQFRLVYFTGRNFKTRITRQRAVKQRLSKILLKRVVAEHNNIFQRLENKKRRPPSICRFFLIDYAFYFKNRTRISTTLLSISSVRAFRALCFVFQSKPPRPFRNTNTPYSHSRLIPSLMKGPLRQKRTLYISVSLLILYIQESFHIFQVNSSSKLAATSTNIIRQRYILS